LGTAAWTGWYTTTGQTIPNPDLPWIQYQLQLTTSDTELSPTFLESRIHYTLPVSDQWAYRRGLFIDNNVAQVLPSGYSIKLVLDTQALVNAGKLRPDGDDLRVIWDNDGSLVELDRIARSDFNTAATEIWFKTQAPIPANSRDSSYFIYYGNPDAGTPPVDPANVWALWDDFDGASLDTALWNNTTGTVTLSGGQAHLASGANIIGLDAFTYAVLETRLQLSGENNLAWWGWEEVPGNANNMVIYEESVEGFQAWILDDALGWPNYTSFPISDPAPGGLTAWQTYQIDWWPGNAVWSINDNQVASSSSNVPNSGIYANFNANSVPINIDWVLARLRVAQEPTVSLATPQVGFVSQGTMLSIPYDTGLESYWRYLVWEADTPAGTGITIRVRTAMSQEDLATAPWVEYNQPIARLINLVGRWVQYEVTFNTSDQSITPELHKVVIYYTNTPAAVTLSSFAAQPDLARILVQWETLMEDGLVGFNLYRGGSPTADPVQINSELILPATSGSPDGSTYDFPDTNVQPGMSYFYWLEIVEDDRTSRLGPVTTSAPYPLYIPLVIR
jgi:hypothetical protein